MEYLTYPFHHPPSPAALTAEPLSYAEHDPLVDSATESLAGSSLRSDSLVSDRASTIRGFSGADGPAGSIHSTTDSIWSRTSSQLISENNEAFSQLRTAGPNAQPLLTGPPPLPAEWRNFSPPSSKQGDWRTFGPVQVRVYSLHLGPDAKDREYKRLLKTARCSICSGTVWITRDKRLLFVFSEGSEPVHVDSEEGGKTHSISMWLHSRLKRNESSTSNRVGPPDEEIPIFDFETSMPITGFQIPLSHVVKTATKKPASSGHFRSSSSSSASRRKRSSSSFSRTLSRTTTVSTTASPSMSRSVSRTSEGATSPPALPDKHGKASFFEASPRMGRRASGSSTSGNTPAGLVVVECRPEGSLIRLEFEFRSKLYAGEAEGMVTVVQEECERKLR